MHQTKPIAARFLPARRCPEIVYLRRAGVTESFFAAAPLERIVMLNFTKPYCRTSKTVRRKTRGGGIDDQRHIAKRFS